MTIHDEQHAAEAEGAGRRNFLLKGGMVAAGAALGATLLDGSPASAVDPVLTPVYFPVGPFRVFDSRDDHIRINTGQNWLLTNTPEPGDYAYTFNVTVTETFGKGWLAVYPGDGAFDGTSSLNWFGNGQDLANNAYTRVQADNAGVNVRCGGGGSSTHFVMDLVAVLQFVDLSASSNLAQRTPLDVPTSAARGRYRHAS